ncbi:MAG: hypothetical protein GVY17_08775 [Cyanobacteria bacterium]|jgi:hypothetical protein|nr:hypothetical protein [Cyanobacteria bacterium GSL.Bin21]
MLKNLGILVIFSATFLGLTTTASANDTTNQSGTQEATINGDNNQVTQIIYQNNARGRGVSKPVPRRVRRGVRIRRAWENRQEENDREWDDRERDD